MSEPLPAAVRHLPSPSANATWLARRILLVALPLSCLTAHSLIAALREFLDVAANRTDVLWPVYLWSAAALFLGRQSSRSVARTWRMYRSPEADLAGGLGSAFDVLLGASWLLLAFAIPGSRGIMRINNEGATKGNLGAVRSALSIYYGDMEGYYPLVLDALTVSGKYISTIPKTDTKGPHPRSNEVRFGRAWQDSGGWLYNNVAGDPNYGTLWIDCTHTDPKGSAWTSY